MKTVATFVLATTLVAIPAVAFAELAIWISSYYQLEDGGTVATVEGTDWEEGAAILAIMYIHGLETVVDEFPIHSAETTSATVYFPYHKVGNEVAYRRPGGSVPPGMREPSHPEPPPPPS